MLFGTHLPVNTVLFILKNFNFQQLNRHLYVLLVEACDSVIVPDVRISKRLGGILLKIHHYKLRVILSLITLFLIRLKDLI